MANNKVDVNPYVQAVPVMNKKKKKQSPLFPVARVVAVFALLTAAIYGGIAAATITSGQTVCATNPTECYKLTDQQAAALSILLHGLVWCSAPQAIVAGATLLLRRRALAALFTLAAFAASHGLFAGLVVLVSVATPADLVFHVVCGAYVIVAAALALVCFIALLRGADNMD